jgi:radical SAM protein with 4Fe4S-binding SPASM domain
VLSGGELLYFWFRIAGYWVKNDRVDLRWLIYASDPDGRLLWEPVNGAIGEEVSHNDENWLPKVSQTLPLPPQLKPGRYKLLIRVIDENEHEVEAVTHYWLSRGTVVKVRPKLHWSGFVPGGRQRLPKDLKRIPCLWAMDTMGIHWNGNIVACVVDCDGKYVAGNVEVSTLKEVWNGPLKWLRELHRQERFKELPQICRECTDWPVKRAKAYFPDEETRQEYEAYIRLGRIFMESPAYTP